MGDYSQASIINDVGQVVGDPGMSTGNAFITGAQE